MYFWVNLDEKSDSVAFQANFVWQLQSMYNSYNIYNLPHEIVTTYPMVIFLLEIPVHQNSLHTRQFIPSIYTTGILQFPIVSISSCSWISLAQGEFS